MAQTVANDMVKDKEKALKVAQNAKSKGGATIAEKIASEQERKASIQNAEQELAIWQAIASVPEARQQAMTEAQAKAEAEQKAYGREETVGLPVALEYLLEGGKGSIESAGYFLYGVQAAFPLISAELQRVRDSIPSELLGMTPDSFVASNPHQLQEMRNFVAQSYGDKGVELFDKLTANSTGFFPREGKEVGLELENLTPVEAQAQAEEEAEQGEAGDIKPIGKGVFGNIYDQFKGKAKEAIAFLFKRKEGEAVGALYHPEIGEIDLVWGKEGTGKSDGFGLAKLAKYHPEVLENLQEILNDMHVTQRSVNRVQLESDTHQAAVRLTWDNESKNWLLTAFEKKNSAFDNTTDTDETSNRGKQNDTATLQNTVSKSKDTTSSQNDNELEDKNVQPTIGEQVQAAEAEVNTNPTEAQKEAGNYKKGHVQIGTFNVTIEQPKGSVRSGVDKGGKKWEVEMQNTYGYIRGTEGVDGDHIDVFLSDDIDGWDGRQVFVVDQRNADGSFDEHKVMLGFNDINDAETAYMSNYEEGWQGLGAITGVSIENFEKWIASSHRKTKAFAEYKSVKTTEGQSASADKVEQYLSGNLSEENMDLKEDVFYENNADAERYLREFDEEADQEVSFSEVDGNRESGTIATDVAIGMLKDAGVEVVEATDAMAEAVLAKGGVMSAKQKRALETAYVQDEHQPTVVSSADGANVLKDLDNAIDEYEEKSNQSKTFLGDIAKALGAKKYGSSSQYATFETVNGKVVTFRLANHNAKVSNFDNNDEFEGISIVVTSNKNDRMIIDGDAHVVEYYYDSIKLRKAKSKPLVEILKSIKQALYSGEFKDTTGLAERQEVNVSKTQFHIATESTAPFYSNAKKAVLDIKQDKATPQQWVAMLKKNGGLKAGEDAWLGLESWLSGQTGSVTKQEIIDYIDEHAIEIEEVNYGESEVSQFEDSDIYNEWAELGGDEDAFNEMIERYGDDFEMAFLYDEGQLYVADEDAASFFIDKGAETINETRLSYTTEGLTDNREIALTVPTIEPYNQNDDIHFGDAGGGRAVAWVRFGETKTTKRIPDETAKLGYRVAPVRVLVIDEIQSVRHQDGREKGYRNEEVIALENRINSLHEKMYGEGLAPEEYRELTRLREEQREIIINANPELKAESEKVKELEKEYEALKKDNQSKLDSEGVELARLQTLQEDARFIAEYDRIEKEIQDIKDAADKRKAELNEFFNVTIGNAYDKLHKGIRNDLSNQVYGVPVAPFEKNWHELAMKRMLRYAAENGYDKVAWTTGAQQAARYDMRQQVDNIQVEENNIEEFNDGTPIAKNITINTPRGNKIRYQADAEGNIRGGEYGGKNLKDVVGKELAEKIMQPGSFTIEEEGLAIGGEGMKGFYDKMLPSFVNKYTKKWGAKVGEVTMPSLEEGYQTMHSVDVTPQMKEDVMKGQPMFLRTPNGTVYGWTQGGKVFLTKEGMNAETPIHEYTHLWDKMVQQKNPELWNRGKELLKQSPTWNEVINDKNYANIAHDEDAVASEVHSRLSGENGAKVLEQMIKDARKDGAMAVAKAASITERIKEWIKDMFAALKETLGAWSKQDLADLSIEDFNNLTLRDLAEGVNPNEYVTEEGDVQFMGSRVDKRKKDIEAKLNGIELSKSQKVVAEAYTTNANNLTIGFKDAKGKSRKIRFRQGNENKAGIKHSVFKHYQTNSNYFSADEILLIPQILEKGKRKQSGKDVTYELHINDAIFIVTTEMSGMAEEFTNFFTNRKPTVKEQGSSNTENQHEQPQQSVSQREVTQNSANSNSISANQDISFRIVDAVEEMVEDAKGANEEQKEAKYAEMDSTIEAADDISNTEEDDDVLYRSSEDDISEDDDLRFREWYGGNSGYVGYSMSKRAAQAREEGRYPKTDFKKEYGVTEKSFNALVKIGAIDDSEWHHTSKYGNKTSFYRWDDDLYESVYRDNKAEIDKLARAYQSKLPKMEDYPLTQEGMDAFTEEHERVIAENKTVLNAIEARIEELIEEYESRNGESVNRDGIRLRTSEEDSHLNQYAVENIFGGIWIEDQEEFAKFTSAVNNSVFEENGEGIAYTDNYFYAYYRNINGQPIPYASVYLNREQSQDIVNQVNQEIKDGRKDKRAKEYFDSIVGLARIFKTSNNADNGNNSSSSNRARNGRLDSSILRKGRYYNTPSLYVKTRRANEIAERFGEGAVSDEGVTMASDPVSKAIGEPRYGRGKKMREYAERQRRLMVQKVQEIAQKLKLDNVEIVTDASTLSGRAVILNTQH